MVAVELPPRVQQQLARFEQLKQQVQMITTQRIQLENQHRELESALEELERTDDTTPIYRSAGMLLIQVKDKQSLISELKEEKETLGIRIRTIEKQERHLKEQYQELQQQLAQSLQALQQQQQQQTAG